MPGKNNKSWPVFDEDALARSGKEISEQEAAWALWSPDEYIPFQVIDAQDRKYKSDRATIEKLIASQRVAPKDQARFIISWLAKRTDKDFQDVLERLVHSYNEYGARFTAFQYRFGLEHNFDWLPETGKVRRLGVAFVPHLKRVAWVPLALRVFVACKERRLREVPKGLYPIPILGRIRPYKR